jgi:hypothetical protein
MNCEKMWSCLIRKGLIFSPGDMRTLLRSTGTRQCGMSLLETFFVMPTSTSIVTVSCAKCRGPELVRLICCMPVHVSNLSRSTYQSSAHPNATHNPRFPTTKVNQAKEPRRCSLESRRANLQSRANHAHKHTFSWTWVVLKGLFILRAAQVLPKGELIRRYLEAERWDSGWRGSSVGAKARAIVGVAGGIFGLHIDKIVGARFARLSFKCSCLG